MQLIITKRMDDSFTSIVVCDVSVSNSSLLVSVFCHFYHYYGLHCTHGLSLGLNICSTLCLRGRE